jgi:hypothetical protein
MPVLYAASQHRHQEFLPRRLADQYVPARMESGSRSGLLERERSHAAFVDGACSSRAPSRGRDRGERMSRPSRDDCNDESESAPGTTPAEGMSGRGEVPPASGPPVGPRRIDRRVVAVSAKKPAKARARPPSGRREEPHLPLAVLAVLVFAAALAAHLLATPTFRPLRFSEAQASCQALLRAMPIARDASVPAHAPPQIRPFPSGSRL